MIDFFIVNRYLGYVLIVLHPILKSIEKLFKILALPVFWGQISLNQKILLIAISCFFIACYEKIKNQPVLAIPVII